jgi:hypothetical protein
MSASKRQHATEQLFGIFDRSILFFLDCCARDRNQPPMRSERTILSGSRCGFLLSRYLKLFVRAAVWRWCHGSGDGVVTGRGIHARNGLAGQQKLDRFCRQEEVAALAA